MEGKDLTEEEIRILCQAFTDARRIQRGKLLGYEKDLVRQLRFGKSYLQRKYPGEDFRLGDCIPQNNINPYTSLTLWEAEGEARYELRLETLADGSCMALDNYYGALVETEYREKLEAAAREAGAGCLGAWVRLPYLYGEEYDASLSLDALLERGLPLAAEGAVYFDAAVCGDAGDEICGILQEKLEQGGFQGGFWIYFVAEEPEGWRDIGELRDFVNAKRESVLQDRKRIVICG